MFHSRLLISVVDDEEPVRRALSRLFASFGFEVETFASGREFLDSLQEHRPDCAILDLHLPELSGLDVQQQLGRDHLNVPVIMITGRDEPGVCERVRAAGATAFLNKPLEERDLLKAIAAATHRDIAEENQDQATHGGLK